MVQITGKSLTLEQVAAVAVAHDSVEIAPHVEPLMVASRHVVESILERGEVMYGINTGFGKLSDVHIPPTDLQRLQVNLVRSHACGVGRPLSVSEVRAMLLLRANVLATGRSGARPEVLHLLVDMLNGGVHPLVPESGSVGASGDLAPLAHLCLALIGEGECLIAGGTLPSATVLADKGLDPLVLEAKEGLALLNGTQAMAAVGGLALARAKKLVDWATRAGAMTLEALMGTPTAFDRRIHQARGHSGQTRVAERLVQLLDGSEIRESHRHGDSRVQDAYSLRCMPQVHGAVLDVVEHCVAVVERETGAATDNPLVFAEEGEVLSGGNFHGAPLALAFDYATIGLTDLMSISERRIDRLVNPDLNEGLPAFLSNEPGVSSGFMIAHVTAVALLNEAKVLSHPASVDNAPTSGGKEDHVSMGMTAALKLRRVVDLLELVVAIELLAAAEGLEYRKPLRPGKGAQVAYERVRGVASKLKADRALGPDIERVAKMLRTA